MNLWFQFGKLMLVLALSLSLGAHWALLQTAAWTGMVISYSRSSGLAAGLSATFDGKHPCPLCHLIKKGRAAENKPAEQKHQGSVKTDHLIAIVTANPLSLRSTRCFQRPAQLLQQPFEWREPPPKPPPRATVRGRRLACAARASACIDPHYEFETASEKTGKALSRASGQRSFPFCQPSWAYPEQRGELEVLRPLSGATGQTTKSPVESRPEKPQQKEA